MTDHANTNKFPPTDRPVYCKRICLRSVPAHFADGNSTKEKSSVNQQRGNNPDMRQAGLR